MAILSCLQDVICGNAIHGSLVFADTPLETETSAADDPFGLRGLRVLGLREEAFPDEDAWKSLSDFFAQHQPVSQEQILSATPTTAGQADPEAVRKATRAMLTGQRETELRQKLTALFAICGDRCTCQPEACRLKRGEFPLDQPPCANSQDCRLCGVFVSDLDLVKLLGRASLSKGDLFSQRLASSVAIHQIYAMAVPRELPPAERGPRKRQVKSLLCELLDCQRNRLQCLKQIGELGKLIPKLLCVQIASGRSLFWEQLRKVAKTVNDQASREAKLTALDCMRRRLPEDSRWRPFLTP